MLQRKGGASTPSDGFRRHWLIAALVSGVTLGSGLLNLFSVMGGPSHPKFLTQVFPLEFIQLSRTFTLLIGFALVISSLNIYARKKRAWGIVLVLSSFSVIFHLTKGLDYGEAAFSLILVVALLLTRGTFSVKSSSPDLRWALLRLAIAGGLVLLYGIAGFWLLDSRHFGVNFHLVESARTTFQLLLMTGNTSLVPRTRYGHWFLVSFDVITAVAIVYAGFAVFRPVVYRLTTLPRERAQARQIIERHARTTLDYFKLWADKSYFFTPSRRSLIAYSVSGNVALSLGDPVGAADEVESTVRGFRDLCRDNGWRN
jgi:phosphatidylglycerol lysyltransferase